MLHLLIKPTLLCRVSADKSDRKKRRVVERASLDESRCPEDNFNNSGDARGRKMSIMRTQTSVGLAERSPRSLTRTHLHKITNYRQSLEGNPERRIINGYRSGCSTSNSLETTSMVNRSSQSLSVVASDARKILFMVGRGFLRPNLSLCRPDTPHTFINLIIKCIEYEKEQRPEFREQSTAAVASGKSGLFCDLWVGGRILSVLEEVSRRLPRFQRSLSEPQLYRTNLENDDFLYPMSSPKTPINSQYGTTALSGGGTAFPMFSALA
uniref:Uncharacterized protein n=1 Tax=Romanomermis culicivorax TaxID=13658 RepID=A0A915JFX4_ROMCU